MSNKEIPCEVEDPDIFPDFHSFIVNPKLYYCYLRYVYNNEGDGKPTDIISLDPRTKIGGSGYSRTIDTRDIVGGGSDYTSTDLAIDATGHTINFKDPALTSEQIEIYDQSRLSAWILLMNSNMEWIQSAINSKMDDITITTNTPDLLSITRNDDITNHPVYTLDVGQVSYTDLSNLRVDQEVKTILFNEDIPTIPTQIVIQFTAGVRETLTFNTNGQIRLDGSGFGRLLIDTDGAATPDFTNGDYQWVQSKKELIITPYKGVESISAAIPTGIGEYILYQAPIGVQDVIISSSDNTIDVDKDSTIPGVLRFDLKTYDEDDTLEVYVLNTELLSKTINDSVVVDHDNVIFWKPGAQPIPATTYKRGDLIFDSDGTLGLIYDDYHPDNLGITLYTIGTSEGGSSTSIQSSTLEVDEIDNVTNINIKPFDPTVAYAEGKLVTYDSMLHKSLGSTIGEWNPSEWINLSYFPIFSSMAALNPIVGNTVIISYENLDPGQTRLTYPRNSLVYNSNVLGVITSSNLVNQEATVLTLVTGGSGGGGDAYVADIVEAETIALGVFNE